ncbi:MAG: cysteine desulfurase [Planctomycetota bacterium]|nr:cysteine desulfurase [Planctomycetota bacterium]
MSGTRPIHESSSSFANLDEVRSSFPCLQQEIHGKPLVYLDSAATTQKPIQVLQALESFYQEDCSNVHRGVHTLSERATHRYEAVRTKVAELLNAPDPHGVIFTSGTTESINLVARTIGRTRVSAGDQVLISAMEHHANIVPWQMLCEEQGAQLEIIDCTDDGNLKLDDLQSRITDRTKVVSIGHVSNAVGTMHDIQKVISVAREKGAITMIDSAQAISHVPIDVEKLGCDFIAFSAHKMYGPTGTGVLWGRKELLDQMSPWQGGGDMIRTVTFEGSTFADVPWKFEAGTPHIAGVIGLGAAIDFIQDVGLESIRSHETQLLEAVVSKLDQIDGLTIIGRPENRVSAVSFVLDAIHPHDAGTIMDQQGVAIRAGHHCAMPLMNRFGVAATIRASFAIYNTLDEIDALVDGIKNVQEVFN